VVAIRWGFNRFYSRSTQESAGFNWLAWLAGIAGGRTPNGFSGHHHGRSGERLLGGSINDYTNFGGGCTNQDVFYSRNFNATYPNFWASTA
jgi:trimeric autotransporter adhesin